MMKYWFWIIFFYKNTTVIFSSLGSFLRGFCMFTSGHKKIVETFLFLLKVFHDLYNQISKAHD